MEDARRIVAFDWVSADGYFAGPEDNLDWVVPDDEQAKAAAQDIPTIRCCLGAGRTNSSQHSGRWQSWMRPARFQTPTIRGDAHPNTLRWRSR